MADKKEVSLAQKFCPIFYLHSKEEFFPVSFTEYLEECELKNEKTQMIDLNLGVLNLQKFREYLRGAFNPMDYTLFLPNGLNSKVATLRDKDLKNRPIYVNTFGDEYIKYINYFHFYAVNQASKVLWCINAGFHYADLEHVQVKLIKDASTKEWKLEEVYFSKHSGGDWVGKDKLNFEDDRVQVFIAQNSHASHHKPGNVLRFGGAVIEKINKGIRWDPYMNIIELNVVDTPELYFQGDLGDGSVSGFTSRACYNTPEVNGESYC